MKKILFKKGFTLIELLVVIAIIALLTAIVTSNFASSKAKSRDAKRVSDIAQIQLALSLFFDKCNAYPGALDVISQAGNGCTARLGDYISVIPKESPTRSYIYAKYPSTGVVVNYVLQAKLETKSSALNDDIDTATIPSGISISTGCNDDSSGFYYCVAPN